MSEPAPPIVCLVDDDLSVRKSLGRLLESAGFKVNAFSQPEAFLDHLSTHFVPVAILDIWSVAQPDQCRFLIEKHGASGDKIPKAIHTKIEVELFVAEEFEVAALAHAASSSSLANFIT